ncbi:MAG: DnaJ domain-containing protein [Cytophagales bacterium]|nr:DnaJ domain-containing protein [Cytophagales bacterium]
MNYYQILGVAQNASQQEIKKKYRQLALQHHPDKSTEADDQYFKLVNEAYQILSDPIKRGNYDFRLNNRSNFVRSQPTYSPFQAERQRRQEEERKKREQEKKQRQQEQYEKRRKKAVQKENKRFVRQISITGIVLLILIGGSIGSSVYSNKQREKEVRRIQKIVKATINESNNLIAEEKYDSAISVLYKTNKKYRTDLLDEETKKITNKLAKEGQELYANNEFQKALKIYESLDKKIELKPKHIYEMAACYRYTKNYNKAIERLIYLINNNYAYYKYYYDIASIYSLDLKQYNEATIYYEKACDIIVRNYKINFGKAYLLTFDPDKVPEIHYAIYYDKGMNYYQLENYELALGAFRWASNLQRENDEPLYYEGVCLYQLQQKQEACEAWNNAYALNENDKIRQKMGQFCQ